MMGSQYTRHQHCLEGTRKRILENLQHWAETPGESTGYWIWGMAGTGKSTIAMSACKIFKESEECALVASFFCSRQIEECRDYQRIIPTLSYQLARTFRRFAVALRDIYDADSDIASKEPKEQVQKLLVEPWKAVLGFQKEKKLPVIVLDALDECTEVQRALEPLIAAIEEGKLRQMKFLFTSRPEQPIRLLMHSSQLSSVNIPSKVKMFELHSVEKVEVQNDINAYITIWLKGIAAREQLQALTELAGNLFIYAATVVKFVTGITDTRLQLRRLEKSLKENKHQQLDQLYAGVLEELIQVGSEEDEIHERWNILHTIVGLFQPMTCKGVAVMANSAEITVKACIEQLQAFCFISEKNQCIHTLHLSFTEYITRQSSESHRQQYHEKLSIQCFREMRKLRFNICDLPSSFVVDAEVKGLQEKIKERIGEALEYSCRFWGNHLLAAGPLVKNILDAVEDFLKTKGVYWIEAMSLTKALAKGGEVLGSLMKQQMAKGDIRWGTSWMLMANLRNLLLNFAGSEVNNMTPHLYLSFLPLWKKMREESFNQGWKQFPEVQKVHLNSTQQAVSIELKVRLEVYSVAFSPDGTRIVSGSDDETVRIWDATTGMQVGESLQGHDYSVTSVAFSPDGTRIVSGSLDTTVRIWDATTGIQVGESLQGHDDSVTSVAFSPDGTRIVSGSDDKTVRIWDATTGIQVGESLQGHDHALSSVAFSPDGTRIVSGSDDKTVRIWDATTGIQVGESLQGHDHALSSVAFSPDGTRIVSGSDDKTVRIWDATTGIQVGESLQGHDHAHFHVAFSPDETRTVSGSADKTVRIWDATTGIQVGKSLQGHDNVVSSVAFSPDGTRIVSGYRDNTVRIWDATTGIQAGESLQGHDDLVNLVASSPHGTRIVPGSYDTTVRIWDATTGFRATVAHISINGVYAVHFCSASDESGAE
ncbi:hypothetical protein D9757_014952 [Collybiopsis confluens]|uniref:Nephrocystin 3-like N-terminal domain-containing protein n=1 Tax=Collybiopsis confluens TaxID=2823264 RepID=A0A8H5CIN6_9AGAR|nr:hypothetical protein D9757_014952 [Collybiopsis confluens]